MPLVMEPFRRRAQVEIEVVAQIEIVNLHLEVRGIVDLDNIDGRKRIFEAEVCDMLVRHANLQVGEHKLLLLALWEHSHFLHLHLEALHDALFEVVEEVLLEGGHDAGLDALGLPCFGKKLLASLAWVSGRG